MTDDILNQVKKAEESAARELDLAKEEARKLVEEAKIKANESYKEEIAVSYTHLRAHETS